MRKLKTKSGETAAYIEVWRSPSRGNCYTVRRITHRGDTMSLPGEWTLAEISAIESWLAKIDGLPTWTDWRKKWKL